MSPTGKPFRFVSFARARGLVASWNWIAKGRAPISLASFCLFELSLFPFAFLSFPFSLARLMYKEHKLYGMYKVLPPPPAKPPIQL